MVWATSPGWYSSLTALSWTPDGQRLAYFYSNPNDPGSDSLGIVDAQLSRVSLLGDVGGTLASSASVVWLSDNHTIAYIVRSGTLGANKLEMLNLIDGTRK